MREVRKDSPTLPGMNLLDRAIAWVNPKEGARRAMARQVMALSGGYHGGSSGRPSTRNWNPRANAPDVDIDLSLPELRPRSRDLARNSPPAASAINGNITSVVGTGLTMRPRIHRDVLNLSDKDADAWEKNTSRRFNLWAESRFCDAEETNDFDALQALVFRSMMESGDVFALTPQITRKGWPFTMSLQILEADRVSNPDWAIDMPYQPPDPNGNGAKDGVVGGIRVGKYGQPLGYYITNRHPGSIYSRAGITWKLFPAYGGKSGRRNVLHIFETLRPNQKRGVPYLAPVIEQLKQISDLSDAELRAAVVSAAFAVFIKMDPDAFESLFHDDNTKNKFLDNAMKWDGSIDNGQAVNLLPGEEISDAKPGRPNPEFDPFVTSILRQIGMALEIPYEVLILHFQSSYSAARAALLAAWRVYRRRRKLLVSKFCQPVYEEWLADEVANGRIGAPGFFSNPLTRAAWCGTKWTGDSPGSIDPEKEVNAANKRLAIGITTLDEESIAYDGEPWEAKHRQQVEERNRRFDDGLIISTTSTGADQTMRITEKTSSPNLAEGIEPDAAEAAAEGGVKQGVSTP